METTVEIIHILLALFMILVVLIQGGNQGGIGAAFGGGNSQGVFGASGATSFLGKVTYAVAGFFLVTSISLTYMKGGGFSTGLKQQLQEKTDAQFIEEQRELRLEKETVEDQENAPAQD